MIIMKIITNKFFVTNSSQEYYSKALNILLVLVTPQSVVRTFTNQITNLAKQLIRFQIINLIKLFKLNNNYLIKHITKLKLTFVVIIGLGLIACTNTAPYGSYVSYKDCGDVKDLAKDAANHLSAIYLPAKVKVEFTHDTNDEFGYELVTNLRKKGYAVQEYIPKHLRSQNPKNNPDTNVKSQKCPVNRITHPYISPCDKEELAIELSYLVDQIGKENLYRLMLVADNITITRPYYVENKQFLAKGDWIRRKGN